MYNLGSALHYSQLTWGDLPFLGVLPLLAPLTNRELLFVKFRPLKLGFSVSAQ